MTGRLEDFLGFRTFVVYNDSGRYATYYTHDDRDMVRCPVGRAVRVRVDAANHSRIVFVELMSEEDARRHIAYMEKVFAKTGIKSRRLRCA